MASEEIGLYIHIPFCKSKCYYCDFNSYASMEEYIKPYFNALKREILWYSDRLKDNKIKTLYIGGGTPSWVDAQYIYEMMNIVKQNFDLIKGLEVSIETNPGTLTYDKLMTYKVIGINRLSMGLQAWQNRLLKDMGRIHRVEEFIENYKLAEKVGFKNINVDLIFGLPEQTINDWMSTLTKVIEIQPQHVSAYSLKIEEDTPFGRKLCDGELIPVEDELDREMYYAAIDRLEKNGYKQYEISNFAKPDFSCRHNLVYWKAEQYLGLGAGAHSYINNQRYNNINDIEHYIQGMTNEKIPVENVQLINKEESMMEYIILGLRLIEGLDIVAFSNRYNCDIFELFGSQIRKLLHKELIEQAGNRIRLTSLGLDLANQVFMEFI